jgi:hypothetical protein
LHETSAEAPAAQVNQPTIFLRVPARQPLLQVIETRCDLLGKLEEQRNKFESKSWLIGHIETGGWWSRNGSQSPLPSPRYSAAPIYLDLSASISSTTNLPLSQHTFPIPSSRYFQSRGILIDNFITSQSIFRTGTCSLSIFIIDFSSRRRHLTRTYCRVRVHASRN